MFALLLALAAPAQAATLVVEEVGGTSSSNNGAADYKLNTYDVTDHGVLELIEVWLGSNNFSDITFVVYEETAPNDWDLIHEQAATITDAIEYKASAPLSVNLVAGHTYAVGVYLGFDSVTYFWDSGTSPEPVSWGSRTGALYSGNNSQFSRPDPINDGISDLGYRQRLTVSVLDDLDGDGWPVGFDCDDGDAAIHPNAAELCDGIDNDCDGVPDNNVVYEDYWPDADGDGFGDGAATPVSACDGAPADHVDNTRDCDDSDATIYPDAPELCDNLDNDCDGSLDEGVVYEDWWPDNDGDGFGDDGATPASTCDGAPADHVGIRGDCDDSEASIYPDAPEQCNNVDDDCDGDVDEDVVYTDYWPDADGDGFGDAGAGPQQDCTLRDGFADNDGDCNDLVAVVNPDATELCDGLDNDCDGVLLTDEVDGDLDGVFACDDCDDDDPEVFPGAEEDCNGIDNDCDGEIPEESECREGADEGLKAGSACGCSTSGSPVGALGLLLLLAAVRRR